MDPVSRPPVSGSPVRVTRGAGVGCPRTGTGEWKFRNKGNNPQQYWAPVSLVRERRSVPRPVMGPLVGAAWGGGGGGRVKCSRERRVGRGRTTGPRVGGYGLSSVGNRRGSDPTRRRTGGTGISWSTLQSFQTALFPLTSDNPSVRVLFPVPSLIFLILRPLRPDLPSALEIFIGAVTGLAPTRTAQCD